MTLKRPSHFICIIPEVCCSVQLEREEERGGTARMIGAGGEPDSAVVHHESAGLLCQDVHQVSVVL